MAYASGSWMVWTIDFDNGTDADYSSWADFQSAQADDLTSTGSGYWVHVIASSGNLEPWSRKPLNIDGWTTDASNRLVITSPPPYRHNGVFNESLPFFFSGDENATVDANDNMLNINEDQGYLELFGLQMLGSGYSRVSYGHIAFLTGAFPLEELKFHHNLHIGFKTSDPNRNNISKRTMRALSTFEAASMKFYNNVFMSYDTHETIDLPSDNCSGIFLNNTFVRLNGGQFMDVGDNAFTFRNNMVLMSDSSSTTNVGTFDSESKYNLTTTSLTSNIPTMYLDNGLPSGDNYVSGLGGKGWFTDGIVGSDTRFGNGFLDFNVRPQHRNPVSLEFGSRASGDDWMATAVNDSTDITGSPRTRWTIGAFEYIPVTNTAPAALNENLRFTNDLRFADVVNELELSELLVLMYHYGMLTRRATNPLDPPSDLSIYGKLQWVFNDAYQEVGLNTEYVQSPLHAIDVLTKHFENDRYTMLGLLSYEAVYRILYRKNQPVTSSTDAAEKIRILSWTDPFLTEDDDFPYSDQQSFVVPAHHYPAFSQYNDNQTWYDIDGFAEFLASGTTEGGDVHNYGVPPVGWKSLHLSDHQGRNPYRGDESSLDTQLNAYRMWDYGSKIDGSYTSPSGANYVEVAGDSPYGSGYQWRNIWADNTIIHASGALNDLCLRAISDGIELNHVVIDLEQENDIGMIVADGLLGYEQTTAVTDNMSPSYLAAFPNIMSGIIADDRWPEFAERYGIDFDVSDYDAWYQGNTAASFDYVGEKGRKWLRACTLHYIDILNQGYYYPVLRHFPDCRFYEFRTHRKASTMFGSAINTQTNQPYTVSATYGNTHGTSIYYSGLLSTSDTGYPALEYQEPGFFVEDDEFWNVFVTWTDRTNSVKAPNDHGVPLYFYMASSGWGNPLTEVPTNINGNNDPHINSTAYRQEGVFHALLNGTQLWQWSSRYEGPDDNHALDDAILEYEEVVGQYKLDTHRRKMRPLMFKWDMAKRKYADVLQYANGSASGMPYFSTTSDVGGNIWTRVTMRPDLVGICTPIQSGDYLVLDHTDYTGKVWHDEFYKGETVQGSYGFGVAPEPSGYWIKQPGMGATDHNNFVQSIRGEAQSIKSLFDTTTAGRTGSEQSTTYVGGNVSLGGAKEIAYTTNSTVVPAQSSNPVIDINDGQPKAQGGAEGSSTDQDYQTGYVDTRQSENSDVSTAWNYATGRPVPTAERPWMLEPSGVTDTFATDSTKIGRGDRLGIHVINDGKPTEI